MQSSLYPKLELKYCERCGGLWLRLLGSDAVYCSSCAATIRELPPVLAPRRSNPGPEVKMPGAASDLAGAVLEVCA